MKFLSLLILLSCSANSAILGIRGISNVNEDFRISKDLKQDEFLFSKYIFKRFLDIQKSNNTGYLNNYTSKELKIRAQRVADFIEVITKTFKIDSFVLLGLLERESFFMEQAISHTNAAGLTQMTRWGIGEVMHQLGIVKNQADTKAVEVFRRYYEIAKKNIEPFYTIPSLKTLSKYNNKTFWIDTKSGVKKLLLENGALSVVFGVIFMKALVAKNCKTANCLKSFSLGDQKTGFDVYETSLISYNGDKTEIKECKGFELPASRLQERYCYAKKVITASGNAKAYMSSQFKQYHQVKAALSTIKQSAYFISF